MVSKWKSLCLAFAVALLMTGCGKSSNAYSGVVVLSSELFGSSTYYVKGFQFETGEFVSYPGTTELPDLVLDNFRSLDSEIIGAGLSSPGNNSAFLLKGTYTSEAGAKDAFEKLSTADTIASYTEISDTIKINQLWLFKSVSGHYAKILVNEVNTAIGLSGTIHYEVRISYVYQPLDTPLFDGEGK